MESMRRERDFDSSLRSELSLVRSWMRYFWPRERRLSMKIPVMKKNWTKLSFLFIAFSIKPSGLRVADAIDESWRGSVYNTSLNADGKLTWRGECLALESEALGFEVEEGGRRIRVRAYLSYDSKGRRSRKDFVLELESDELVGLWSQRLTDCFNSFDRPKRLFIIVNPFGGKKCARKIFNSEVKPLLVAAGVSYTMQETDYQLHAQEIAYKLDFLKYDGIVCVSGDGVLVEIVNGLLQRDDWDTAIRMPLGIIPAGSGNGMAKSLLDSVGEMYSISNATFSVIRGHKRSLDVSTVIQGERKFFSVLMLTWGLIADIDIESEKYRWMGSTRFDFYTLLRVMKLRKYHGRVQFVPAPGYETYGEPLQHIDDNRGTVGISKQAQKSSAGVQQGGYPGPPTCAENLEWRCLDGPFISVWLNNVPWAGEDVMPAPEAKFSDGYLDVVITRDCSKSVLLGLMMKMADGSHIKSPHITYMKVTAFRLEPGQRVGYPTKGGIIDSDGEVLARGEGTYDSGQQAGDLMAYGPPIDIFVDKGLATIFSPI